MPKQMRQSQAIRFVRSMRSSVWESSYSFSVNCSERRVHRPQVGRGGSRCCTSRLRVPTRSCLQYGRLPPTALTKSMSPREQYPQLIVCAVTAYGDDSPLATTGMDILAQARVRTVGTVMTR